MYPNAGGQIHEQLCQSNGHLQNLFKQQSFLQTQGGGERTNNHPGVIQDIQPTKS